MAFTLAPLLIFDPAVPPRAREALRAGLSGPPEARQREFELAARVIFNETELDCREARELVGLSSAECAAG